MGGGGVESLICDNVHALFISDYMSLCRYDHYVSMCFPINYHNEKIFHRFFHFGKQISYQL